MSKTRFECFECARPADHAHHVVPVSQGGKRTIPLCIICHGKVHDMTMRKSHLIKRGMAAAKAKGVNIGRGPKSFDMTKFQLLKMVRPALGMDRIAKQMGFSRAQLYKRVRVS